MRLTWKTEWPNWVLLLAMLASAAVTWSSAPERFPAHWGLTGQVDRYGGKVEGMLALPLGALALYIFLLFLPRIDPGRANYAQFAGAYAALRIALITMMAVLYAVIQLSARGYPVDTTVVVPMVIGGLLFILGSLLGKIRPNWFVGIRTPWTLASKRSWTKTHRLGGWLFIAIGLALILAGALHAPWAFLAAAVLFVSSVVWIVAYSYLVWRGDPDKVPPSGTLPG